MSISNRPLDDIYAERLRQDEKWGPNPRHTDFGAMADTLGWAVPSAEQARRWCESAGYDVYTQPWAVILLEEFCEAMEETEDTQKLRTELIQVAAVCAGWVQDIDSRVEGSKAQHPSRHDAAFPGHYIHRIPDDIPPHSHPAPTGHSGHIVAPDPADAWRTHSAHSPEWTEIVERAHHPGDGPILPRPYRDPPTEQEWQQHWEEEARGIYMMKSATRKDGTVRRGDNWQKGMPKDVYTSSLVRHVFHAWGGLKRLEELEAVTACGVELPTADALDAQYEVEECVEALCAVLFNAQGLIYELTRG